MRHRNLPVMLGAALLVASSLSAVAGVVSNPYEIITLRNIFGLRPVPPPEAAPPPVTPVPPAPEIRITGITTLLGAPRALFQYEDKEAKKLEFPPLLAEGESYKALTVVSIDAERNSVRIKNGETEMLLDFANNGVKATAMVAAVPPPAAIPPAPAASPGGRVILGGPTGMGPTSSLPPDVIARLRQRMQEQQSRQIEPGQSAAVVPPEGLLLR